MRINYLLEDTVLFGGVKVVLHQANLMTDLGHDVRVVSPGGRPDWFELRASSLKTQGLEPHEIPPADVTVATFWTTVLAARRAVEAGISDGPGELLHFCQGFEAELTHNADEHPRILRAYDLEIPAMTVSPHLADLIRRRFRRPARVVPQPLGREWRSRLRRAPGSRPRILITGPWEIYLKGVPVAIEAVLELRRRGIDAQIVRLSQWPLCDAERELAEPDELHCHLPPHQVPPLVRSCDLLLAPSWKQEGFGLPVLEAMAAGIPAVVSDIPSFRAFAEGAVDFVPFDDPIAFADRAEELLRNPRRWRSRRKRGLGVAKAYAEPTAARAIESALRWAADGSWRGEIPT